MGPNGSEGIDPPNDQPSSVRMSIAVVIPYYQRASGLLVRALQSVLAQRDVNDVQVLIIDDSSPIPAVDEIARLGEPCFPISVVVQANGGPAAARNRGLDALGNEVDRVAFLDSDDLWTEFHLSNAVRALDAGHDFYFSDHSQPGQNIGAFARAGRIDNDDHPSIGSDGLLHTYSGDMFDQIISGNVIGTSTVVYDFDRFRGQRFDEAFFSAGEDYLFWIDCTRAGARFCFSSAIEAQYGYGVNIYAGSGWGTDGYLRRIQNEMRYRKRLLDFDLSPQQRSMVDAKIRKLRFEFADDVLHRLSHRKSLSMHLLGDQLRLDPATVFALPINAGQLVAQKLKGRAHR